MFIGSRCKRLRHLHRLIQLIGNIPRQQFLNAVDWMLGNALKNVLQIALRIDVIELTWSR